MSVGDPKIPQGQQGIGHHDPVQSPGQDSGNIKAKESFTKKIGHKLAKLLPERAKKLLFGYRSVQVLLPQSIKPTTGLKEASPNSLSVKPLSERNAQFVDVAPKLAGGQTSLVQKRESVASADSAFSDRDSLSVASTDGYESVKLDQAEFIDDENGYMEAAEATRGLPIPNEDGGHYQLPEDLKFEDAPDTPGVNEEARDTAEIGSGQDSSVKGQEQTNSSPDEPTISAEEVLARKFSAYEELIDNNDLYTLSEKLSNTNDYQTAKKVAQLALEKQGKESTALMFAQSRMQELKADQIVSNLGGYQVGADYNEIRNQAAEIMNQPKYSKGFQAKVLVMVDQRLKEYEIRFEGMTPFGQLDDTPPPVPEKSEQLMEDLTSPQPQETKVGDEPPPLPPRPETSVKKTRAGRRMPGGATRGR